METSTEPAADHWTDPPTGPAAPPPEPTSPPAGDHRVVAGAAFELAGLLGVDPLWVRLAFVALTLIGGLGLALYAAVWLVLGAGRRGGAPWMWFGVAGVVMWVWAMAQPSVDPTLGWIGLLGGAALALWQPRTETVPGPVDQPVANGGVQDEGATVSPPPGRAWGPRPRPRRLVRRQPSILGRATLGIALLVAAGGALIDQLNGGRLHPEQWLGAAAVVCGFGMIVGAWRGRGLWLLLPAAAFAGSGWVAGHAARAGVEAVEWGDHWLTVDGHVPPGGRLERSTVFGDIDVSVYGAPGGDPVIVDARTGIGDIRITVDDEVTVEVRAEGHDGDARSIDDNGAVRTVADGTFVVGPEGPADVIVRAETSRGDIEVHQADIYSEDMPPPRPDESLVPVPPLDGVEMMTVRDLGEGMQMTSDGTIILPDNAAVLSPDGAVWLADGSPVDTTTVTRIDTAYGEVLVLPDQTIVTSSGTVLDVTALRASLPTDSSTGATPPADGADGPLLSGPTTVPTIPAIDEEG